MKLIEPRTISGFMELLPADQSVFNRMIEIIKEVYQSYGFQPIETPAIEYTEILLAKGSSETDKQLYRFTKGSKDLALHFDLTVPLARFVAQHYNELTFPFKRHQIQKVWRGERAQKGRFREFYQCDIDVIGSYSPMYDAELPAVIHDIFTRFQLPDFVIRLNNRKILNGFFASLDLKNQAANLMREVDKIEKIGAKEVTSNLIKLGITADQTGRIIDFLNIKTDVIANLKKLPVDNELFRQGIDELEQVINTIKLLGLPEDSYKADLSIARGLDYYTGTVYETQLIGLPEIGSICSGGRYDDLSGYYTKEKLPGVGISIGLTRLFSQLKENNLLKIPSYATTQVLIINLSPELMSDYLHLSQQLRQTNISCEIYYENANFKKQLKYADKLQIPYVIFYGDDEKKQNVIKIKDMTKREERVFALSSWLSEFIQTFK